MASLYEVLTVPAVILTLGDKEFARQARFIDLLGTRETNRSGKGVCGKLKINILIEKRGECTEIHVFCIVPVL